MNSFTDAEAKAKCQAECDKRNRHVLKTHKMRWKPLWNETKGWQPAFRPQIERVVVERKSYVKP